jgi:hypothetical protein
MRTAAPLLAAAALAGATAALAEGETPVQLRVGEAIQLCAAGLATCPLQTSLCDDPKVALIELGKSGPTLRGVAPGTTLCGLLGSSGFRRVLRVEVKPKGSP